MTNGNLLGRDKVESILKSALAHSKADQTQVTLTVGSENLTRFANSVIHQNVAEVNGDISVKAVIGKKIGFASTNSLEEASVLQTVEKAVMFAEHQQENPDFVSLPKPTEGTTVIGRDLQSRPLPATFFDSTATFGPEDRAAAAKQVVDAAQAKNAEAAGSYSNSYVEFGVANSLGISQYNASTVASLSTVVTADSGFGYAARMAMDARQIDPAEVGAEAVERAASSRNPGPLDAGGYDVILLPYAVAELIGFLAWLGLGALSVQEERSFMCGKFGERVCGENISIWEDGLDPRGMVRPFDPEGVPKQRIDMIDHGIARAVVYDSYTAHKEGRESTGHCTGGTGVWGPMPANVFVSPGEYSVEEMIASVKHGLLVTRFHYVNVLQPVQTILTGMTRDGTFLIENGKVSKPVMNLRFTESVLDALANVEMLGKDLMLVDGMVCVPAMKVKSFRFTGSTEF